MESGKRTLGRKVEKWAIEGNQNRNKETKTLRMMIALCTVIQ